MSAGTYSQTFDSLATNGTTNPWTDNSTLPGWYAGKSAGDAGIIQYSAGTGSGTGGSLYSFGSAASTERAVGSLCSSTVGSIAFGVRFTNDTDLAQTNITVSYTGEQWRNANGAGAEINTLSFSYRISNSPLVDADASNQKNWISVGALNFNSPVVGGSGVALNGNLATNRQVFTNIVLGGVTIYPGQEIFLRWLDVDNSGGDAGIAVDDLTVSFTPVDPSVPLISLLTYNVKGNGVSDWSTNTAQAQAIGRQLIYLSPDIITFNEIPNTNTWQMTNWVTAFLPNYYLATNSGNDGFIRSIIASRYPIIRSSKWLDGASLQPFGYTNTSSPNADNFTRDLFEAEIAVPNFPRSLHVFTTHLKSTSGTTYSDAAAKRSAEAAAITNFFATNLFVLYPNDPYTLSGDMNDSDTNTLAIQRLVSAPNGLWLTNPTNPVTGSINTYSTTGANPSERIDYIFPGTLMFSNIASSQVFRTDRLTPLPPNLNSNDCKIASDHFPVLMVFNNPFTQPFRITSVIRSNESVVLAWNSVPGQTYCVENSSNLIDWFVLADNLLSTNYQFVISTNAGNDKEFFRLKRLP